MSSVTPIAGDQRPAASDHRWLILVIVAIAQLMVVLDATVVNIALPSAQHALGFPNSDRQWVVTAYTLSFGSLLLVGGRLGDMFSRKWGFITGLVSRCAFRARARGDHEGPPRLGFADHAGAAATSITSVWGDGLSLLGPLPTAS